MLRRGLRYRLTLRSGISFMERLYLASGSGGAYFIFRVFKLGL